MTIETRARVEPRDHVVLFYENDYDLVQTVVEHLTEGLLADEAAVVVATADHIDSFEAAMVLMGVDVAGARADGSLVFTDAGEALSQILVGQWPDADAFATGVAQMIRRVAATDRPVRVYGEMVALLWGAGQVSAAIELEELWNGLGRLVPFSLFCAYPADSVSGHDHEQSFHQLCYSHSAVVGEMPNRWASDETIGVGVGLGRAEAARSFTADTRQVSAARQFVVDTLIAWDLGRYAEDAALVVSELATNSILHAGSDFIVAVSLLDEVVRVSVRDASLALPVVQDPAPSTVSGRGLLLVAAIGHRWGTERLFDGKLVWVELHS